MFENFLRPPINLPESAFLSASHPLMPLVLVLIIQAVLGALIGLLDMRDGVAADANLARQAMIHGLAVTKHPGLGLSAEFPSGRCERLTITSKSCLGDHPADNIAEFDSNHYFQLLNDPNQWIYLNFLDN
jgi:hypothetical protein